MGSDDAEQFQHPGWGDLSTIEEWTDWWRDSYNGELRARVVTTVPVGSYPAGASPYGALDMAGNVFEWTENWFDSYPDSPYPQSTVRNDLSRHTRRGLVPRPNLHACRCPVEESSGSLGTDDWFSLCLSKGRCGSSTGGLRLLQGVLVGRRLRRR